MGETSFYRCLLFVVLIGFAFGNMAHAASKAIVISVSRYPYLEKRDLEGPVNDAALMLESLRRMGLDASDITLLSESPQAKVLPTRANILASLAQAAKQARPGDWMIVFFSGHGSQQPQHKAKNGYIESDGLDEIFLPRDTRRWVPEKGIVEGALLDDDIGLALGRITDRGANVWAIFDTCHAGDMAKGGYFGPDAPVLRYISPYSLDIPASLITRTLSRKNPAPRLILAQSARAKPGKVPYGQLIAFYAAGPDEPAAEELLPTPENTSQRLRYGVFTYALHQQLNTWQGNYQDLADGLRRFYKERPYPTPQFEGALQTVPNFPASTTPPDKTARAASLAIP